ncbi:hypothetical protein [Epibacterium ulvae]|uniref:hypothetical protein n=1 Tax=Epibacterium ulvae TaxID=1156985 RepID=UPI0024917BD8|nr:hypothetical protein [Epibacterium ulvae]
MSLCSFNILIVAQAGRLQYEALLFAASLRQYSPKFQGRLIVAVPQMGPLWTEDPSLKDDEVIEALSRLGAEIVPFENKVFGERYKHGNKIEALKVLPPEAPFIFFDSDTLITNEICDVPFDFTRPSASLRREGTWPKPTLYGPGHTKIWQSLYTRFGLDFESSLDPKQPEGYWKRYLYFNAGFFYGSCPRTFGTRFLQYAETLKRDLPRELIGQSLNPWLDQVALPLVIHSLGGGRDTLPAGYLDGHTSCHYRLFPLLYARESDRTVKALEHITAPNWLKRILKRHDPIKRMVYQGKGAKVRALFDQNNLPKRENAIRKRIKAEGYWIR